MSIAFSKYVRITSGVGGAAVSRNRELIPRVMSTSELLSPDAVYEFTTAEDVGNFFGKQSEEYKRALFAFAWISPLTTALRKISFGAFPKAGNRASVFGRSAVYSLDALKAVGSGTLELILNGTPATLAANLTGATSLSDVAVLLTAALAAESEPLLSSATCEYDATAQRFEVRLAAPDSSVLAVTGGTIAEVAGLVGVGTITTVGSPVLTAAEAVSASIAISDNCGSVLFTYEAGVTSLRDVTEVAQVLAAENVKYQYYPAVARADWVTFYEALKGIAGVGLHDTSPIADKFPEMMPAAIMGATDYTRFRGTQGYMYRQFDMPATITDTPTSNLADANRINYYGQTKKAGAPIEFYQRGKLTGGVTAPVDMNVYANEQWLKDYAGSQFMDLLVALAEVPASDEGRGQGIAVVQAIVDRALFNGVISPGKELTTVQRLYVAQVTGDPNAWRQIENLGYWYNVVIDSATAEDGTTEYTLKYVLLYAKKDLVRAVEGTHTLI